MESRRASWKRGLRLGQQILGGSGEEVVMGTCQVNFQISGA